MLEMLECREFKGWFVTAVEEEDSWLWRSNRGNEHALSGSCPRDICVCFQFATTGDQGEGRLPPHLALDPDVFRGQSHLE